VREPAVTDSCPSLGDLVLAADGGLSPSHKAEMTAHLGQCQACRNRLQQANAFLEASAELDDEDLAGGEELASESPASVSLMNRRGVSDRVENTRAAMSVSFEDEIGAEFDSVEKDAARHREFVRRLHKQKQDGIHRPTPTTAWVRKWLPAAAVIPLLIFGLALPRMQTVVRAEELLTLASNHESSLPADRVQRLRIRLTPRIPAFTPQAGGRPAAVPPVAPFFAVRNVTGLAAPGGVSSVGASSDGLSPDGESSDGASTSGEYTAVERMLAHHGFEWRQPLSLAGVRAWRAVKAAPVAPTAPLAAAPVGMTTVPSTATAARDIAADAALSPVTTVVGRAPVMQPGLSRWLDRTFGARPERKAFVPDLQRLVTGIRQNLSALDTLGRRYPEAEIEQQWSDADQAALRRRVNDSYRRISRDLNDLDARIGILFGSTTRSLPVTEAPADWRQRAADALAHAEAMDAQVRQLLTFDDVPSAEARVTVRGAGQVPSTFAALWDVVHAPVGGPASRY
jgi:hypothetical protein